jgi:glucose-6-phosphate dehydrogenase assembly protein OpcA
VEAALTEGITLREIERELGRLRDVSTAPGHAPRIRTSVMTHIAWVPERWTEAATATLAGMEERHPSRGILLFPRPDEPEDRLDGEVDVRCFVRGGEDREVCAEVIALRLCGARAAAPASVVMPLLVSDLPVFLRWRGEPAWATPELEQLTEIADRLVVDSSEWAEPEEGCAHLCELFDRVAVSDIAWARGHPWRLAVAALWPEVSAAQTLHVAGPRADAVLLAAWLGARLQRELALEHEPAGEIELVEVDGSPARPARAERKSPSDLLSDQLELFGRDRLYEESVRSFSPVLT